MIRRLSLTSVVLLIVPQESELMRLVFAMVITLISLCAVALIAPYRRTDNNTDSPRRTFWQVFCRDGFDLGNRLCGHLSAKYRAAQTIPGPCRMFPLPRFPPDKSLRRCGSSGRIALMDDTTQRAAGRVRLLWQCPARQSRQLTPVVGAGLLAFRGH